MAREEVEPTITEVDAIGKKNGTHTRMEHPAFGVISVSKMSGNTRLFDSEFSHQNFITMRVKPAYVDRHLSRDWIHSRDPIVEVSMSEHQWARMLSSIGVGEGVPCTLQRIGKEMMPAIPKLDTGTDKHVKEMLGHLDSMQEEVHALKSAIAETKMTKTAMKGLLSRVERIRMVASSNLKFVANSFSEHIEETVEAAKTEVAAHAKIAGLDAAPELGQDVYQLTVDDDVVQ